MTKQSYLTFLFLSVTVLFSACDIEDRKAPQLYGGNGKWEIESYESISYDEAGAITNKSTLENLGYIQFMSSESLFGLYGYRVGLFMKIDSMVNNEPIKYTGYFMEYVYDGKRFQIRGTRGTIPIIEGLYTITKDKKNRKEFQIITSFEGTPVNDIHTRAVLTLKKM